MKCILPYAVAILVFFNASLGWSGEKYEQETVLLESSAPLTPEELFEIAQRHNPDHQKSILTSTLSGVGLRSAWGTLLPVLDVGFQISQSNYYNPTFTNPDGSVATYPIVQESFQSVYDTLDNGHVVVGWDPNNPVSVTYPVPEGKSRASLGWVSLRETIYLGGQQLFTIKNAFLQKRMNDLQVSSSQINLFYNVRQTYYNTLAQKHLLELANRVLEQKREQLRLAQVRYEVGSVTELDVLQAEIDVGNQENEVIAAENELKMARESLNQVLGVDLDSRYELVDNFAIFKPEFELDTIIQETLHSRPDLEIYQKQESYQRNLVHSRRGEFLPNLSASVSHSRSENSGANVDFTLRPRNRNTQTSLSLSWNLFSGFSDEAQYQESRVSLRNAQHDLKKQEQAVEKEVRAAYYTLQQTYEQSKVTQKNRELASRQLALEQERYRLGATSQLNLRAAQVTYEQAESDYIAKVFNFWSNLATLEKAVGEKLH
ncbi:MAG: TolC family protein [bacterium]